MAPVFVSRAPSTLARESAYIRSPNHRRITRTAGQTKGNGISSDMPLPDQKGDKLWRNLCAAFAQYHNTTGQCVFVCCVEKLFGKS